MKTIKYFVLMLLIILSFQNSYSYVIGVSHPCNNENFPSPYFYPNCTVNFNFRFDSVHVTDSKFARCRIYTVQRGTEVLMYDQVKESGVYYSVPINTLNFLNLAFNEPVRIKIVVTSALFPNLPFNNSGYSIVYKEGMSTRYGSISNGSAQLINTGMATFFSSGDCLSLASGVYFIRQYKINFVLHGNFTDSIPVVDSMYSLGYSGSLPGFQIRWGFKTYQTPTEARFITFVYDFTNILGQSVGFKPCEPHEATVVYHYVQRPVIANPLTYPSVFTPSNNVGIIACNLLQGTGDLTYKFLDSFNIHNHQLIRIDSTLPYAVLITNFNQINNDRVEPYKISSQAYNQMDSSGWKSKRVIFGDDPHGCPMLSTKINGHTILENAILIQSGGDSEKDVTDFCMTFRPLIKFSDTITFSITETTNDETKINEIAMFQATVDKANEFAVTDGGKVINYIPDASKTKATLNNEDVTEKLSLIDNETEKIKKGDKLFIEFEPEDGDKYMVLYIRTIGIKNLDAAMITTSAGEKTKLKFRNGFSKFVLEAGNGPFNGFELEALQELEVDQVSVAKNENTSVIKQLKLLDAFNNQENVSKLISQTDKHYAYVSNGNPLTFNFENNKEPEKEVFYYFKFTGSYESASEGNDKISGDPEKKYEFKLSENQPNPFNPVTKIKYEIPEAGTVKLTVFDISGREIKTLVNEFKAAGIHESVFDGSNLASGVYFYKLQTALHNTTKRMILIK